MRFYSSGMRLTASNSLVEATRMACFLPFFQANLADC